MWVRRIKLISSIVVFLGTVLFGYLSYSYAKENSRLEMRLQDLQGEIDAARSAAEAERTAREGRDNKVVSLTRSLRESHDRLRELEAQNETLRNYLDVVVPDPVTASVYDNYRAARGLPPSSRTSGEDSSSSPSSGTQNRDYIELINRLYEALGKCNADKEAVKNYYNRLGDK